MVYRPDRYLHKPIKGDSNNKTLFVIKQETFNVQQSITQKGDAKPHSYVTLYYFKLFNILFHSSEIAVS